MNKMINNFNKMSSRVVFSYFIESYKRPIIKKEHTNKIPFAGEMGKLLKDISSVLFKHKNIWITGGIAREALRYHITGNIKNQYRDLDLVVIGSNNPNISKTLSNLSKNNKLFSDMTEEQYSGGFIDTYSSFENYMDSRDMTINEVLYCPGEIVYTLKASRDIEQGLARSTKFEFERGEDLTGDKGSLGDRAILRLILMAVRENKKIGKGTEKAIKRSISNKDLDSFQVVIHLLKAIKLGLAQKFINALVDYGYERSPDPYDVLVEELVSLNRERYEAFELRGREKDIQNAIEKGISDSKAVAELLNYYPEIKNEVNKSMQGDFEDYENFLTNRNKKIDRKKYKKSAMIQKVINRYISSSKTKKVIRKRRISEEEYSLCPHCGQEIGEKEMFYDADADQWYHSKCSSPIEFPEPDYTEYNENFLNAEQAEIRQKQLEKKYPEGRIFYFRIKIFGDINNPEDFIKCHPKCEYLFDGNCNLFKKNLKKESGFFLRSPECLSAVEGLI